MKTKIKPEFDLYAERYEEALLHSIPDGLAEDSYFAEYKIRHMANRVKDKKLPRILDFGCGVGRSLGLLNQYFPKSELWGYDVSEHSVDVARHRINNAKLTSNPDSLPLYTFDLILAANVFHHIPVDNRCEAIEHCSKLLKKNGHLFLFEHNPFNPLTRLIFERCPFDKGAIMLKRHEALKLGEAANLVVVKSGFTLFFPRQLAIFRPLEKFMCWMPFGAQYYIEMAK